MDRDQRFPKVLVWTEFKGLQLYKGAAVHLLSWLYVFRESTPLFGSVFGLCENLSWVCLRFFLLASFHKFCSVTHTSPLVLGPIFFCLSIILTELVGGCVFCSHYHILDFAQLSWKQLCACRLQMKISLVKVIFPGAGAAWQKGWPLTSALQSPLLALHIYCVQLKIQITSCIKTWQPKRETI